MLILCAMLFTVYPVCASCVEASTYVYIFEANSYGICVAIVRTAMFKLIIEPILKAGVLIDNVTLLLYGGTEIINELVFSVLTPTLKGGEAGGYR